MIGDFFESFIKEKDEQPELPQEIINIFNEELPGNLEYVMDENGNYRIILKTGNESAQIDIQIDFEKVPELRDKLMSIPFDKWDEYLHRTQTSLPFKSAQIGDENKKIPIERLLVDPFHAEEAKFYCGVVLPYPFQIRKRIFESPEGDIVSIEIQQQAYDNVMEVKFSNVNFPALKIDLYLYSPLNDEDDEKMAHTNKDHQYKATYSVTPTKAATVKEAVIALHLFRGFYNSTTKIDGKIISSKSKINEFNSAQMEDALYMWETALKIEDLLGVCFKPDAEFSNEDKLFFTELKASFLDGKSILWRHPFDHFRVGGMQSGDGGVSLENYIGKESVQYEFLEGPIPATLLGAQFELYSHTKMKDFVITNIEWEDKNHENAEVYISDSPGKQWSLSRSYMTKKQAEELKNDRFQDFK